jgi:hypothetical protein
MGYSVITDSPLSEPINSSVSSWIDNYKQQFIEQSHDQSMLNLVTPDDSLVIVGPPRLSTKGATQFYVVGFIQNIQYNETSQVQPLKAIGSRRHIFARTNTPVQGTISRLLILGGNLYRALYALTDTESAINDRNSQYADGDSSSWFTNLEEDLYRLPFGLGIIYNSPATAAASNASSITAGAEFLEVCTIVNRGVSKQSGQAMVMEQVTFMADRVVPWRDYYVPSFSATSYNNHVEDFMSD